MVVCVCVHHTIERRKTQKIQAEEGASKKFVLADKIFKITKICLKIGEKETKINETVENFKHN